MTLEKKKMSVDAMHPDLSIRRQCELLGMSRSILYKKTEAAMETGENLKLMKLIDSQFLKTPFYGSRRITAWLQRQGYDVNRKRVQRLMRIMNIEGIAPGPKTSKPNPEHEIYPYRLRKLEITKPDQV